MTIAADDPLLLRDAATKAAGGGELTAADALALYRGLDQPSLGLLAHDVRTRLHPAAADGKQRVTYIVDRNLNRAVVRIRGREAVLVRNADGHWVPQNNDWALLARVLDAPALARLGF